MTIKYGAITLYEDQELALSKLKNGNVLVGDVGSGKTFVSIFWYLKYHSDKKLLVITTPSARDMIKPGHKKPDWHESIEACGVDEKDYHVDSWNNIDKYKDVKNICIIFDEQRAVGYGKWARTFIKLAHKNNWIMTSATPGDTWMDYIALFCANGFYQNKTRFTQEHVVWNPHVKFPVVQKWLNEDKLKRLRESILVDMGDKRKTRRHILYKYCYYDGKMYNKVARERFNYDTNMPIQNASEFNQCLRRIVNTHESRAKMLTDITKTHDRVIIFYNYTYEYELIIELAKELGIAYSAWNGKVHQGIPETEKWMYIVQYNAAEAWNCITTNCIVFWSVNYSYRKMEQASGRIDRMNTPYTDLYYYYFTSYSLIDKKILQAVEQKKKFNDRDFAKREYNFIGG